MSESKVVKTPVIGIRIVIILSFITFGNAIYFIANTLLKPDLDLYVSVNKYHFQKPNDPNPRVYFCFDLAGDQIQLNKNCDLSQIKLQHCGIQNEESKGWNSDFLKSDPHILGRKSLNLLIEHGCESVVLDFEGIPNEVSFNDYWDWKSSFTHTLKKSFQVSLAVYSKTEKASNNPAARFHDYSRICDLYDEVWLMTYDFHLPTYTSPGEIAPLNWVKDVVAYALTYCNKKQIRIGLAAYGYDWSSGKPVHENQNDPTKSLNFYIETAEKRREKVFYFRKQGILKYFIWAEGMFTNIL